MLIDAPVALSAINVTDKSFTARWEAVQGAEAYLLDVATDSNFETLILDKIMVLNTSYDVTDLLSETTYFYRVFAVKQDVVSNDPLGNPGGWILTAEDHFTGSSLDESIWTPGFPYGDPRTDHDLISVSDNALHLAIAPDNGDYKGSAVHLKEYQQYGFWEYRARFPQGGNIHNAGWLWNWLHWQSNYPNGFWAEADTSEFFGGDPGKLYRILHWGQGGAHNNLHQPTVDGDWEQYHIFGFELNENWCKFFLDGVPTAEIPQGSNLGYPLTLIFGYMLQSAGPNAQTPWAKTLDVDYVKVWQYA